MEPMANPAALYQPSGVRPMMTNSTTPTMAMVVYCRLRYALAPAWMAAAISCMRALPAGSLRMAIIENTPYRTAITPAPIASQSHVVATMGTPYKINYLVVVQECHVRARHPERARTISTCRGLANRNETMTT
jgi:hypothetical protein